MTQTASRDGFIDFLRFFGLAFILFAHVEPPHILLQLRNFDVPLMVMVSAIAYELSFKADVPYGAYFWSRIKRLVFPTWIFLTLYFGVLYFLRPDYVNNLQIEGIIRSFAFVDGIGYVWIIRVFLMMAIVAPFIYKWHSATQSDHKYLGVMLLVYLVYEAVLYVSTPYLEEGIGFWVSTIFYYLIPYSLIFAFGLRMRKFSFSQNLTALVASLLVFIIAGIYLYNLKGYVAPTWHYKWPPSAYFIFYGLGGCLFCWMVGEKVWSILEKKAALRIPILFIAQNSLWIYLWHIPFAEFIRINFLVEYAIVLTGATACAAIQVFLVRKVTNNMDNVRSKKFIRTLFTG